MLSGPIYRTGSINGTKAGHGLAHTELIFEYHNRDLLFAEDGSSRNNTLISESPKGDEQSSGQSDDSYSPSSLAAVSESPLKPQAELALWLESKPTPGNLYRHRAYSWIARFVDPKLAIHVSAIKRSRCQAGQRADLSSVFEFPPAEEFHHEQP